MKTSPLKVTTIRLPQDLHERATEVAAESGRSFAGFVRFLVESALRDGYQEYPEPPFRIPSSDGGLR